MKKILTALISFLLFLPQGIEAQVSRKMKSLQNKKKEMVRTVSESQKQLDATKMDVAEKVRTIDFINVQLESRLNFIKEMEPKIARTEKQIQQIAADIEKKTEELNTARKRYKQALIYSRTNRAVQNPWLFVFSAETITQMYRRARYAREYATHQRNIGLEIKKKQAVLMDKQEELLEAKSAMSRMVAETQQQRKQLFEQQKEQQKLMDGLQQREKKLVQQLSRQRKELAELDKKIDDLIAYELEQARKRAEEEARRKAAAEKKKQQAIEKKKKAGVSNKDKKSKTTSQSSEEKSWRTSVDHKLDGNFERNKGKLPVPITGSYMVSGRFGTYDVPGLKNVRLESKGINYIGRSGAMARSVFDGEVTAVFQFGGTMNVLIRHGSYISVYCNLSSVKVKNGQRVRARDVLGAVANDGSGNCVLHFQLRKERTKLNPELWISR